jgi:hypothetical protein
MAVKVKCAERWWTVGALCWYKLDVRFEGAWVCILDVGIILPLPDQRWSLSPALQGTPFWREAMIRTWKHAKLPGRPWQPAALTLNLGRTTRSWKTHIETPHSPLSLESVSTINVFEKVPKKNTSQTMSRGILDSRVTCFKLYRLVPNASGFSR